MYRWVFACVAAKVNVVAILGLGWYWIGADLVLGSRDQFWFCHALPSVAGVPLHELEGRKTYRLALIIPDHVSDLLQHIASALLLSSLCCSLPKFIV